MVISDHLHLVSEFVFSSSEFLGVPAECELLFPMRPSIMLSSEIWFLERVSRLEDARMRRFGVSTGDCTIDISTELVSLFTAGASSPSTAKPLESTSIATLCTFEFPSFVFSVSSDRSVSATSTFRLGNLFDAWRFGKDFLTRVGRLLGVDSSVSLELTLQLELVPPPTCAFTGLFELITFLSCFLLPLETLGLFLDLSLNLSLNMHWKVETPTHNKSCI
mmetsp:Transcript_19245/g.28740  ORF Transcript_19245/g.28740 Transcript_19245/m.28740 type:complete len:220 (-) Transcript_19245:167-826(-)